MEEIEKTYKQKVKASLWIKISSKKEEDCENNPRDQIKARKPEECFCGGDFAESEPHRGLRE